MKGKSITFNKYFVYVMILVATLILCVATFSLLGINKAFTPSAEGEVVTSVTSSLEDDNLTVEGLGTHYFKDDAVFTITTKESASGLTLIGVNATYTTGDNAGKVVTLAKEGSTYALYGVTGDFTLKGNWVAKSFTATWTISNGTIYNQDGTALDINMPIYYGIGIPAVDMPYVDAAGNRYFDGWKVTGERVNTTTNEISTYSASYIPKNAISATCSAPTIDVSTYNTQNFTNDDGSGSLYYDSEDHVKGVVAAGGLHNDCKDTNDDSTKDVSTATKLFKQGHLYSGQTDGSMSGLGVAKYGSKAGFYAYAMIIPVRFDGKIRQDILSGKLKNPNITINAQLKAGTQKNNTSNYARTSMWIDVSSSIITSLTFTNNKSLSDGCITSTNYPGGAHTITGSNKDGVAISAFNARNSSGWAIANSPTGGYTKTVPLYDADHPSPNGFVIGIWIHLYSDGASRHFAIVKSIDYTVTGNDGYTATYTLNLDSNSPEEGLESELISSNAFTRDSWMVNETPFEYEGYNFKGWSTEKGGEIISDSLKVLEGQTETTYYANWEKKNYAYVTAEDYTDGTNNVSEVLSTEIKEHGTSVTVPNRNEGDKYIGFNYDGLSPSGVSEGDTIPLTGSMRIGYKYSLLSPEVVFNDKEVTYGERINLASLTEITSNPLEGSTRTNRYTIAYTLAGNPVVEEDLILVLDSGEYLATLVTSVDIVALSGEIITLSTSHSDTANLNISKRVAQIVWPETLSFTYDATEKAVPPTISNVAFEDDVTLTVVGSTGTDASDYCSEITAISDADNYALPLEGLTKEWSILARELTVSEWVVTNGIGEEATELIYDGKSYTAQAIIENAVTEIAVVYENEVNSLAGTYTAKVSLGDTETNYVLDDEGVEYVYVIAPRMVEVSWDYVSSFTYDATEKKVGYTFVNKVSGDSVTLTDSGLSATNAGDYTAKITAVNNANYALPEGGINLAWTIQKRTLSVAWNDKSYTYNGQYQYPQATVTNALASENIYLTIVISGENTIEKKVSGTGAESYIFHSKNTANTYGEPIDAGSYTITFNESVCLDEDYTIVNNNYQIAVEEKAFTIAPKSISGSGNWSYDEDAIYMGALTYRKDAYVLTSYFNSGVLSTREDTGEKDQVALTYENNTQANAGTYLTTMSSANANYVLTGNNTIEWEILPLVATLAWTEEMEYTYDGTAKSVTAVVSNAIDSEVVTLQMEEDVKTDAGNYTSTIKGILNANYSLPTTNLTREWVIKKANIEGITLAGGTYTYDRTKKTATLSGTKTQFGEDVTSNLTVETDATSVGDHVYTAVLSAGDNYNELTLTATVVIEKADITGIELKDGTFTFDNTEKSIAVSKLLTQYMDGASVTYSGGENLNKATNAGEYTIVAIVKAGNNYNDLTLTATLSINKANVSGVKFSNKNVVYNATAQSISIEGASALFGEITYTINGEEGNSAVNVGTYTIVAKIAESANYNEGTISATLTINKATIEGFSVEDATYTYNKEEKTLAVVGTTTQYGDEVTIANGSVAGTNAGNYILSAIVSSANYEALTLTATLTIEKADIEGITLVGGTYTYNKEEKVVTLSKEATQYGDEVEVVITGDSAVKAGTYTYTAVVTAGDNYNELSLNAEIVINKATIEGFSVEDATYTYDKEEKSLAVVGTTTQYGDEVTIVNGSIAGTDAGNYTLRATISSANYEDLTLTATLTINKATIEGFSVENATYTYDKKEKSLAVVGTTTQYGDEVTIENGSVAGTDAGTYTLSAIVSSANYEDLTLTATLTIEKADIEGITLVGGTYTYNKEEKVVTLSKETTQYGDEVEVVITGDSAVNAGTYTYTAVVTVGANYNELSLNAEIVINKATIEGFSVEDATYTYDKEEKSLAVVGTTTQYGDEVAIVNGSIAGTDAGNYTLRATITSANYEDLTLTATLTIEKADIEGITLVGGTYTYNKEEKVVTLSKETTQYGDEVEVVITGDSAVNVGTYIYTAVVTAGDNYNELSLNAEIIINKATIEGFSVEDATYTYNKEEKTLAVVGTTTQYGDEVTIANGSVAGTNAGNYILSAIVSSANYEDLTLEATLTIEKADIEGITLVGGTYTYDKEEKVVTLSKEATQYGDEVEVVITGDSAVNAGTYTYTAVVTAGDNYNELSLSTDVIIEKKNISVIGFTDGTTTYGVGDTISYTYSKKEITLSAVYGEDDVIVGDEVSFVVSGHSAINAGKNTLKVTLEENENYNMSPVTKAWSIAPKTLEVEWIGDAKVGYNGEAHEVEAILVGVIEGDEVELTTSGSSNVNAGSYTAKAISLSNNNYTISASEYKYEIEKAIIKGISLVGLSTTYTGEQFSLAISDKETQFGDAVSVSYKYVYGDIVATEGVTEAGDYEVTATVTAGANYEKLILSARLTLKPVQMESEEGATIETEEGFTPGTVLKTKTKLYSANEKSEYVVELSETERIALAIEVSLTRNDVEVTPEGIMVLRLALPEEMQNVEFRMLAILGNETVEIEYAIEDDCVVVETDELCTYVFVTEYTTTEKLVAMLPYIIGGIVALALVIGVVIIIVIRSKKHTIKFVSNGVELKNSLGDITAKYGQKVSLPTPAVGGMYFEGCYSDPECTKKAKVSDLRDGDAQFYSKRVKTPRGNIKVPQAFLDTVKFGGWYLDEGCTIKADLNKMGKKDVTLYAKWSKKSKKSSYKVYPWEK